MTIKWISKLSVGNDVIDDDHKHLIDLINVYEHAISMRDLAELKQAFDGLVAYAEEHFTREENMMEAVHYPRRNAHRDAHRSLLQAVHKFHDDLAERHKIDLEDVSKFLHDWLVDHVVKEDLELKPYLMGGRK